MEDIIQSNNDASAPARISIKSIKKPDIELINEELPRKTSDPIITYPSSSPGKQNNVKATIKNGKRESININKPRLRIPSNLSNDDESMQGYYSPKKYSIIRQKHESLNDRPKASEKSSSFERNNRSSDVKGKEIEHIQSDKPSASIDLNLKEKNRTISNHQNKYTKSSIDKQNFTESDRNNIYNANKTVPFIITGNIIPQLNNEASDSKIKVLPETELDANVKVIPDSKNKMFDEIAIENTESNKTNKSGKPKNKYSKGNIVPDNIKTSAENHDITMQSMDEHIGKPYEIKQNLPVKVQYSNQTTQENSDIPIQSMDEYSAKLNKPELNLIEKEQFLNKTTAESLNITIQSMDEHSSKQDKAKQNVPVKAQYSNQPTIEISNIPIQGIAEHSDTLDKAKENITLTDQSSNQTAAQNSNIPIQSVEEHIAKLDIAKQNTPDKEQYSNQTTVENPYVPIHIMDEHSDKLEQNLPVKRQYSIQTAAEISDIPIQSMDKHKDKLDKANQNISVKEQDSNQSSAENVRIESMNEHIPKLDKPKQNTPVKERFLKQTTAENSDIPNQNIIKHSDSNILDNSKQILDGGEKYLKNIDVLNTTQTPKGDDQSNLDNEEVTKQIQHKLDKESNINRQNEQTDNNTETVKTEKNDPNSTALIATTDSQYKYSQTFSSIEYPSNIKTTPAERITEINGITESIYSTVRGDYKYTKPTLNKTEVKSESRANSDTSEINEKFTLGVHNDFNNKVRVSKISTYNSIDVSAVHNNQVNLNSSPTDNDLPKSDKYLKDVSKDKISIITNQKISTQVSYLYKKEYISPDSETNTTLNNFDNSIDDKKEKMFNEHSNSETFEQLKRKPSNTSHKNTSQSVQDPDSIGNYSDVKIKIPDLRTNEDNIGFKNISLSTSGKLSNKYDLQPDGTNDYDIKLQLPPITSDSDMSKWQQSKYNDMLQSVQNSDKTQQLTENLDTEIKIPLYDLNSYQGSDNTTLKNISPPTSEQLSSKNKYSQLETSENEVFIDSHFERNDMQLQLNNENSFKENEVSYEMKLEYDINVPIKYLQETNVNDLTGKESIENINKINDNMFKENSISGSSVSKQHPQRSAENNYNDYNINGLSINNDDQSKKSIIPTSKDYLQERSRPIFSDKSIYQDYDIKLDLAFQKNNISTSEVLIKSMSTDNARINSDNIFVKNNLNGPLLIPINSNYEIRINLATKDKSGSIEGKARNEENTKLSLKSTHSNSPRVHYRKGNEIILDIMLIVFFLIIHTYDLSFVSDSSIAELKNITSDRKFSDDYTSFVNDKLLLIYENDMIPLHNLMSQLRDQVDALSKQQKIFKYALHSTKRVRSMKFNVRRCVCMHGRR